VGCAYIVESRLLGRSLSEQIVQGGFHLREIRFVLRNICSRLGLEVIAKIGFILFANLLRGGFFAMFRIRRVVLDAQLACVQFSVAGLANIQAAKR
jgi:hypothetical protein